MSIMLEDAIIECAEIRHQKVDIDGIRNHIKIGNKKFSDYRKAMQHIADYEKKLTDIGTFKTPEFISRHF